MTALYVMKTLIGSKCKHLPARQSFTFCLPANGFRRENILKSSLVRILKALSLCLKHLRLGVNTALLVSLLCFFSLSAKAQMWTGQDTLYGYEWIDYDKTWYKFYVSEDGWYRIPYESLENILPANLPAQNIALYRLGRPVPLHASTSGPMQAGDYLEFYGRKNRAELDSFLFAQPEQMFNPYVSLFNDSAAYFLSWDEQVAFEGFVEEVPNDVSAPPPAEPYCMVDALVAFFDSYVKRAVSYGGSEVSSSHFRDAEGYSSGWSTDRSVLLETPDVYIGGPDAQLSLSFTGRFGNHLQQVWLNGQLLEEFSSYGMIGQKPVYNIAPQALSQQTEVEIKGVFDNFDKIKTGYVRLRYARGFAFGQDTLFSFSLSANGNPHYLEISGYESGSGGLPALYDLTNGYRLAAVYENNLLKFLLPAAQGARDLLLVKENIYQEVSSLEPVTFTNIPDHPAAFIVVYHKALNALYEGEHPVDAYVEYRSAAPGNAMSAVAIEVDQLYDQFAYGIRRHPLAIRNFAFFAKKHWPEASYLFIIGRGYQYPGIRYASQLAEREGTYFFVPTFGYPPSDNLLVADAAVTEMALSIGRFPAKSPKEVMDYLNKVKEFEANQVDLEQTIADKIWMKEVMHLGGGGSTGEQQYIKGVLLQMENTIENNRFGGHVTSFYKTSSDPIETTQSEALKQRINEGISILSFFGHSSANVFDFNFDNPDTYDNFGKYPWLMSYGCFSGNAFINNVGIGERFVLAPGRGSIAFSASTSFGFSTSLERLGKRTYELLGDELYGMGIGDVLRKSAEYLWASASVGDVELGEQNVLQGDPSLRLNAHPGPDYLVDEASVGFDPELLNTELDSFDFFFDLVNLGYYLKDTSIRVQIEQELPDGNRVLLIDTFVAAPAFRSALRFTLPGFGEASRGMNRFYVTLDADNMLEELPAAAENNNYLRGADGQEGVPVYIVSNDLLLVSPPDFAIVQNENPTLRFSTLNPFAERQKYIFQIDTTEHFNSPLLQEGIVEATGGAISWTPALTMYDSTVYYWRVSPDSLPPVGYRWKYASFIYLPQSERGWNQSHYFQFAKDHTLYMEWPEENRTLDFASNFIDVKIKNRIYTPPYGIPRYFIDNETIASYYGYSAFPAGVMVGVLDSLTAEPWINPGGLPYGDDYAITNQGGFLFATDSPEDRAELIDFLENTVPDGFYVVFFTVQKSSDYSYAPESWVDDLIPYLQSQGCSMVAQLPNLNAVQPYSLFYRKGHPEFGVHETITEPGEVTEQHNAVPGDWYFGHLTSPPIGPSASWESLHWAWGAQDSSDVVEIRIHGLKASGQDTLLMTGLTSGIQDLQNIDAAQFPYLQLEYVAEDEVHRSPPQLLFWRVHYQGLPDAAVAPNKHFSFHADTLQQGDRLQLELAVENVSDYDLDSLLVRFSLLNANNELIETDKRFAPLPAGDSLQIFFTYDTHELEGNYFVIVLLNPDGDQEESTLENNRLIHKFQVVRDERNPLLDVTFDGEHIFDGDLVSARPEVIIQLKDENAFLPVTDSTAFRLLLKEPDGNLRRLYFSQPELTFFPATGEDNRARVRWTPEFEQDGAYSLYISAQDASGNASGDLNYVLSQSEFGYDLEQRFRVITQSSISNVLNYPNPFSTQTYFVYTLTGSEPPATFRIQIYTVSGRLVRELTQADLGPLRIGTHRTDLPWDGTDAYGERLANGVYLYRILAQDAQGREFDFYPTGADTYFKQGFGKLVIIR